MTMRREGALTAKQLWDNYNYVDGIEVRSTDLCVISLKADNILALHRWPAEGSAQRFGAPGVRYATPRLEGGFL
jgi:hypothetical protein